MAKRKTRTVSQCECGWCEICVNTKIAELEAQPCACTYIQTERLDENGQPVLDGEGNPIMEDLLVEKEIINEDGSITIVKEKVLESKCERCHGLEKYQSINCFCAMCTSCTQRRLEIELAKPCTCTYKTIEVEETIINPETGLEEIAMVDKVVVDVECSRCIESKRLKQILSDYDVMRKAYIDEKDFGRYNVVDGKVVAKVAETGKVSDIDKLKENVVSGQFMQDMAINTMMFEIIPDLESRLPQSMLESDNNTIKLMKGLVRDMGAFFADRISTGVVTYEECFSISYYKKYQAETDVILKMTGFGHLIVPLV